MRRFITITLSTLVVSVFVLASLQPIAEASYTKSVCGNSNCPYAKGGRSSYTMTDKFFNKYQWIMDSRSEISLTDDQVSNIKSLKHEFKKDIILLEAQIDVLALDIKSAMHQNPIDVDAVNALVDRKYDLKKTKVKSSVEAIAKLKSEITPGQWTQLTGK